MNLIESLAAGASRGGGRAALVAADHSVTYAELTRQAGSLAAHLRRLGVQPGDRVALVAPTLPEYVVAYYGILGAGAVVVPLNSRARAPELRYVFDDCDVRAAIVHSPATDEVRRAVAENARFRHLIHLGGAAPAGTLRSPTSSARPRRSIRARRATTTWPRSPTPRAPPGGRRA